jgi:hypothetical protein
MADTPKHVDREMLSVWNGNAVRTAMNPMFTCRRRMGPRVEEAAQHVVSNRASQSCEIHVCLRARGLLASRFRGTKGLRKNGPSGWQGSGLLAWLVRWWSRKSSSRGTGEGFRRNRRLLTQGPALLSGRAGV